MTPFTGLCGLKLQIMLIHIHNTHYRVYTRNTIIYTVETYIINTVFADLTSPNEHVVCLVQMRTYNNFTLLITSKFLTVLSRS